MSESTKIDFQHRHISQLSDFTELIEMLFPGNRNQRYAAACIFFELKWAKSIVPNLTYLQDTYGISRRVLQRARAKLARLGLIEHVSYLNSRYGGQHGWKLSGRFETGLRQMAEKCALFRDRREEAWKKEETLLAFVAANRWEGRDRGEPDSAPASGFFPGCEGKRLPSRQYATRARGMH